VIPMDPNQMAALDSFAATPPSPAGPAPVPCGACGTIIDPVTGEVVDSGAGPAPLPPI